jgi:hypothetical protein
VQDINNQRRQKEEAAVSKALEKEEKFKQKVPWLMSYLSLILGNKQWYNIIISLLVVGLLFMF